jgi:hypothetical protein
MASLADLEGFLQRIFERSTARLLGTRLTAIALERRLERTMDLGRRPADGRTTVPGLYRVRLHPRDLALVAGDATAEELAGRLADAALAHARRHRYVRGVTPTVSLVADPSLEPGDPVVEAVPEPGPGARTADAAGRPGDPPRDGVEPAGRTMAFRRPDPRAPRATLRITLPGSLERTIRIDGTPLAIGRAPDNALVLEDPGVSRHHARIQARSGMLVFTDLGSTNGSHVNGVPVDEVVLGSGDRIAIGAAVLVVEAEEG